MSSGRPIALPSATASSGANQHPSGPVGRGEALKRAHVNAFRHSVPPSPPTSSRCRDSSRVGKPPWTATVPPGNSARTGRRGIHVRRHAFHRAAFWICGGAAAVSWLPAIHAICPGLRSAAWRISSRHSSSRAPLSNKSPSRQSPASSFSSCFRRAASSALMSPWMSPTKNQGRAASTGETRQTPSGEARPANGGAGVGIGSLVMRTGSGKRDAGNGRRASVVERPPSDESARCAPFPWVGPALASVVARAVGAPPQSIWCDSP